jgi:tripartite-type tricarboxylate transporter receptor subunit TctC
MLKKVVCVTLACTAMLASPASAQSWPSKQITLVVGTTAGGSLDLVARVLATHFEKKYKQPVIVENRTGAGGVIAGTAIVRAAADGHTFGTGMSPANDLFIKDMPYKSGDLAPAALIGMTPYNIMVSAATKHRTLAEFVAHAKANPGKVNFGTVANTSHETEIVELARVLSIDISRIGYKGIAPIYAALITGSELQATISAFIPPQVRAGQMVILATGGDQRLTDYPDVPTFRELGYDHFPRAFYAFYARADTPRTLLERFAADALEAIKSADFNDRVLKPFSVVPWLRSLDEATRVLNDDYQRQRAAAQRGGIQPQ